MQAKTNLWFRVIAAFLITGFIFTSAFLASNYFNDKRTEEVRAIENRISTDILSLETQFDLLEQLSCEDIETNPVLTRELSELGSRLDYMENTRGSDDPEVLQLKKSYSLLLIKDSILMSRVSGECNSKPLSLFYFYSNSGDCTDCRKQGYVLTALQQEYPQLRVYAFDYNLDLPALRTLIAISRVENTLPALTIGKKTVYGFQSREDIETLLPELALSATNTATSSTTTPPTRKQ